MSRVGRVTREAVEGLDVLHACRLEVQVLTDAKSRDERPWSQEELASLVRLRRLLGMELPEPWGVRDILTGRWWPRSFATAELAEAHLTRCRGPGTRAAVTRRTK